GFSAKKKERVAMKRRYQIDQQRAVQQFRQLAREENPNIQMMFPMAEVVGLLQEGVGHRLRELRLCTVLIDGSPFRDRQMIVALGINIDGRKTVLGLREGATENAAVV